MRPNLGGKERNKHQNKRHGGSPVGKQAVVGMKRRDGTVRAMPVERTDMATLKAVVSEHVDLAATVYTDEFGGYNTIPQRWKTVSATALGNTSGAKPAATASSRSEHC